METKTLINASAEVVTIRTLKTGDVYRRLETSPYTSDKIVMGVVTDIGNNGDQVYVQALEVDPDAYDGKIEKKSFSGERDLALFTALPEEFTAAVADSREAFERDLAKKKAEVEKAEANRALLESMLNLSLTTAETERAAQV